MLASHDHDSVEKVETQLALGATVNEFPVTVEVAEHARAQGQRIVVGRAEHRARRLSERQPGRKRAAVAGARRRDQRGPSCALAVASSLLRLPRGLGLPWRSHGWMRSSEAAGPYSRMSHSASVRPRSPWRRIGYDRQR